jgi:protein-S-isoprenylcysteine O-methyltransferase Ste14
VNLFLKPGIFILATLVNLWFSRSSLQKTRSHGFYRFFVFESIMILILLNIDYWFMNPFSWNQILSWIFLLTSIFLAIHGFLLLGKSGQKDKERTDTALKDFEKTAKLVKTGAYRYIRHPLYSSLLFLSLGTFLKNITLTGGVFVLMTCLFLFFTVQHEESENLAYFGEEYKKYMKKTRMFIPYLF